MASSPASVTLSRSSWITRGSRSTVPCAPGATASTVPTRPTTRSSTSPTIFRMPAASPAETKSSRVFDNWTMAGIAQWVSGTPASISFSTVQGTDLTGGGDGQRVNVVGNPNANGSTFYAWFNPAAFAVPGKGDPGNAAKNSVRNPGVNNTDLSLSKRFPLKSERRYFQLRWEAYNTFNHTQYSGINTGARFDLTTGAQVNALFGQVSSTRTPRIMQGSLRLTF